MEMTGQAENSLSLNTISSLSSPDCPLRHLTGAPGTRPSAGQHTKVGGLEGVSQQKIFELYSVNILVPLIL